MPDKKIRRYALIALIVAIALGVWGEVSRVLARSSLGKETAEAAIPTVTTVTARAQRSRRRVGAARRRAGIYRGADLRAHQRLS